MDNNTLSFGVPATAGTLEKSLSTGAAGKRCGITGQTIREYIRTGRIRGYRVGPRNYRIPIVEIERFLTEAAAK